MRKLNHLTDQQLIHLHMEGDTNALGALIMRYKDKIYTSIYLLVREKSLAEDIFQDTFIHLSEKLKSGKCYKDEGKFLPWAIRVAHNIYVDHIRKVKSMPVMKTDLDINNLRTLSHKPDNRIIQNQRCESLKKLLDQLPVNLREILIFRFYTGLKFKEISQIKNCPESTLRGQMRFALIDLKKIIRERKIAL